jgi:(E)-4-hydroxy-3-methylbut-2-enyl-diphosphate synthase
MKAKDENLFPRRATRRIRLGGIPIGGGAPISVQSMTKTDTRDAAATISQIRRLKKRGCDIVRLAVPDAAAAASLGKIRAAVKVPLVADIHFDHKLALAAIDAGMDGLRINPGNIGSARKVAELARAASAAGIPIRIGVNSGSIEKDLLARMGATAEAMAESALRHIRMLEDLGFFMIKVSLKASDIARTIQASRKLAEKVDYPFHAGVTEAGGVPAGSVKSAEGLALLLREGLADTIRVSLTGTPEREVEIGRLILRNLGLLDKGVDVVSCPTCGRCEVDLVGIAKVLSRRLASFDGPFTAAVMGCTVNGPGEAREADIGVACGRGAGTIFRKGRIVRKVGEGDLVEAFLAEARTLEAEKKAVRTKGEGKK